MDTEDLGDFVIARTVDEPLYHLTVVVDDYEMGITHIIRGDDGISNTPRQILIQEAIGANRPLYAHIPLILAEDRSKLSSRHGAVSVTDYRDMGYLPEAILNFLALLGWNPGTDKEIFSIDELIKDFTLDKVQKSGAVFNVEKLNWYNKKYIEMLDDKSFVKYAERFMPKDIKKDYIPKLVSLLKEKISFGKEIEGMMKGELSFVYTLPHYPKEALMWKQEKDITLTKKHLKSIIEIISDISPKDFTKEKIKEVLWPYAEKNGKGNVLWPMRYALSGKDRSPDPFILAYILDKDETLKRLNFAHEII